MIEIKSKKILKWFANLQIAIGLLFTIGFIISIGTIIEQDQSLAFYQENYSENKPLLGFLTWKILLALSLNKIYSSWWFLLVLVLFGGSLLACTFTTQLPALKTFKLWKFISNLKQYEKLNINDTVNRNYSNTLAYNCNEKKYHFFRQQKKSYAYSGLLGRMAPIVVHGSIILLLTGSILGTFQGYTAQEIVPRGEIFHIQNLTQFGRLSYVSQDISCRVNDFWITYTKEFKTDQFYSDLSLLDKKGQEIKRKTVFVNEPLNFQNILVYQTDWDILGLKLKLNNGKNFQIPLKKITKGGRSFWFGSIDLQKELDGRLTIIINDLTGKLFVYNTKGVLLKEITIGSSLVLQNGVQIQFTDYLLSTGLQIKQDPGISAVYFAFFFLMISTYVSFFTYSQIWWFENAQNIIIGGQSNRAVLFFQDEFRKILKRSCN
jgi:cytochrome c biogenesis protein